jgi:hypothetical protein
MFSGAYRFCLGELHNRKDTSKETKNKNFHEKISDVAGLPGIEISWEPFYCNLTQEEVQIVCRSYSRMKSVVGDNSGLCFVCAIHPSCTHVLKKYK